MRSTRIPAGREVFLALAKITKSALLRLKYLSNYRRRLHRDWGWQ